MTPQAVVFDVGNVLIAWQPQRLFDAEIGEARRRALFDAVDLHRMNERVDRGEPFREVIVETARARPDWHDEIMLWHDRWLDMASPAIAHSVRLMAALQARGVPVFSLTNFGIQTFEIAADRYNFLRGFDRDFISGHLGVLKPDPEIYAVLERTSGVAPEALLFTDDRPENTAAAAARGWRTHLFEGPQGWADRLMAEGLLEPEDAK